MTLNELQAAGFQLPPDAHARLARFVDLLLEANRNINLTSADNPERVWREHILDCLAILPLLAAEPPARLLDLGAGGGLPGLVIGCALPQIDITLMDATRKKVAAVEAIARELSLANARGAWGRAEVLAHEPTFREQFDAVAVRAVAELRVIVELAAGFLRPGGALYVYKTSQALAEELPAAGHALRACCLSADAARLYSLSAEHQPRVIQGFRKQRPLPPHLPRAPGRPKKEPL